MLTLGVILIIIGLLVFHPLFVIGVILAVIGAILWALHVAGHGVGGRHYW